MKEIKFRAWDLEKNEWQYQPESGDFDFIDGLIVDYDKERFEIEQYTGLKDKSGKEIYENDIIKVYHPQLQKTVKYIIIFQEGCYIGERYPQKMAENATIFWLANHGEIIGNIHEGAR